MKNIIISSILFCLVCLGCKENLSRSKAEALLHEKLKLPQVQNTRLKKKFIIDTKGDIGSWGMPQVCFVSGESYYDVQQRLQNFKDKKVIELTKNSEYQGLCQFNWMMVTLTEEGKKYLVKETGNEYELKTQEIVFGNITGILTNEEMKTAEVEYTLETANFTPFAHSEKKDTMTEKAQFALYDDGWRIKQ